MSKVLWVYFLLANLKHKSRNSSVGREKQGHSSGQLSRSPKGFLKGVLHMRGGLVLRLAVQSAMCLLWWMFLKWMPRQQKA